MIPGGADAYAPGHGIYATLLAQAVTMSGGEVDPVRTAVEKAGVCIVLGVHERDEQLSRTMRYDTIGPDGGGRPRARRIITDLNPAQKRLYNLFNVDRYTPRR
jgi:hypothetical protein